MSIKAVQLLALAALIALSLSPLLPALAEEQVVVGECRLPVAAVASGGGGVIGYVDVRVVYPGSGRVYLSTSPATEIDTQGAARFAAFAAALAAGVDFSSYDYFFDLESPSVIVGGPSAGLPMALAALAALKGLDCGGASFVATGMVLPDGSVGPVGGLKEKLQAAAEWGASIFIVPRGQLVYRDYERVAERIGPLVIVRNVPVEVDLEELGGQLGVDVVEAATLRDAAAKAFNDAIHVAPAMQGSPGRAPGLDGVYAALEKEYARLRGEASGYPQWLAQLVDAAELVHGGASEAAGEGLYMPAVLLEVEALSLLQTASWLASEAERGDWSLAEQVEQVKSEVSGVELGGDESDVVASILLWRAGLSLANALQGLGEGYSVPRGILGVNLEPVVELARALWLARAAGLVAGLEWPAVEFRSARVNALLGLASDSIAYALALTGQGEAVEGAAAALKSASTAGSTVARAGLASEAAGLALAAVAEMYSLDPSNAAGLAAALAGDSPAVAALLQIYEWAEARGDRGAASEAAYAALALAWLASPGLKPPSGGADQSGGQPLSAPEAPAQANEDGAEAGGVTTGAAGSGLSVVAVLVIAVISILAGAAIASRLLGSG